MQKFIEAHSELKWELADSEDMYLLALPFFLTFFQS